MKSLTLLLVLILVAACSDSNKAAKPAAQSVECSDEVRTAYFSMVDVCQALSSASQEALIVGCLDAHKSFEEAFDSEVSSSCQVGEVEVKKESVYSSYIEPIENTDQAIIQSGIFD